MDQPAIRPLNVTKTAKHRVVVGLSWDPAAEPRLFDKLCALTSGKVNHHDLDLSCYIFSKDHSFLGMVSADPARASGANDHIYHSGDNVEGVGDGDDEEISVELKDIPADIQCLVFTATISSGHCFQEINSPEIHLYDAYTKHDFLKFDMMHAEKDNADLLIFALLDRMNEEDWMLHRICTFLNKPKESDILERIKQYLP